ncbi:hypothetical protein ACFX19_044395 [Malus domestica]
MSMLLDSIRKILKGLSNAMRDLYGNHSVLVTRMGFLNNLKEFVFTVTNTYPQDRVTSVEMPLTVQPHGTRVQTTRTPRNSTRINFDLLGLSHLQFDGRPQPQVDDDLLFANLRDYNPSSHIMSYRNIMDLFNNNDLMMCKIFPSTLKRSGMKWYVCFLPFVWVKAFSTYRKKNEESLREYIKCFCMEIIKVDTPDDHIAASAFKK